jgi:hypothetical protein
MLEENLILLTPLTHPQKKYKKQLLKNLKEMLRMPKKLLRTELMLKL